MQKLWLLPHRNYSPTWILQPRPQLRWFQIRKSRGFTNQEKELRQTPQCNSQPKKHAETPIDGGTIPNSDFQRPSLLEELFPEETENRKNRGTKCESEDLRVPRLSMPNPDREDELQSGSRTQGLSQLDETSKGASRNAYRQWSLTVLVARRASKSLDESDFRRIAPKGHHIEDWKGPGDFLKVIPARDQFTLQQSGHYFLLFPNPAYARAYQGHVIALHRISRAHTPTSIESPITSPQGMVLEGEDVGAVLQNYSLCLPSQQISLKIIFPPYSSSMKRLLEQRGYSQITESSDKTSKSVLFWTVGHQATLDEIQKLINQDGRHRGRNWTLASGNISVKRLGNSVSNTEESQENFSLQDAGLPQPGSLYPRYVISFSDENEARRFIRLWHRKQFPLYRENVAAGEPLPLVHAEFLW